jgi:hypothetical protein
VTGVGYSPRIPKEARPRGRAKEPRLRSQFAGRGSAGWLSLAGANSNSGSDFWPRSLVGLVPRSRQVLSFAPGASGGAAPKILLRERKPRQDQEQYSARHVEIKFRVRFRRRRSCEDALLRENRLYVNKLIAPAERFRSDWARSRHDRGSDQRLLPTQVACRPCATRTDGRYRVPD